MLLGVALGLGYLESAALSLAGVALLSLALTLAVEALLGAARRLCVIKPSRLNPACAYMRLHEENSRRLKGYIDRWGLPGLALFVAIPLPATGMYTGAAAAALLGIRGWRLLAALAAGGALSVAITGAAAALGVAALSEG
jgi:uncharacterized membrane protein